MKEPQARQSDKNVGMDDHAVLREYYDGQYHAKAQPGVPTAHLRKLARRLEIGSGDCVLDVACGTGAWLSAAAERGATVAGIDISARAVAACQEALPQADLRCGVAESLPWPDGSFDLVSCLGSLEHFPEPTTALAEMIRVGKPGVRVILLVPNADFLTRKLGLFSGTDQVSVREDVRTLAQWNTLFEQAGLKVISRWKDLHVLSIDWIARGKMRLWPLRLLQALALPLWPLGWQYQVYHACEVSNRPIGR